MFLVLILNSYVLEQLPVAAGILYLYKTKPDQFLGH